MTDTNNSELSYARQNGFGGTLPANPDFRLMEFSELSSFGNTVNKAQPTRISRNRNPRKKRTTGLDSGVEFTSPLDQGSIREFAQGFCFAQSVGAPAFSVNTVTATRYSGLTISDEQAGKFITGQTILMARGFANDANNGEKILGAAVSSASTTIQASGLSAESVADNRRAELHVAGVRGAVGDFGIDADGNLTSSALDFTGLGLSVGQAIYIGGTDEVNNFDEDPNRGFARVDVIEANKLTLSKRDNVYVPDTGSGVQIDILYGEFIRNYASDHDKFQRLYYMFGLKSVFENPSKTTYEYSKDNVCDSLSFNLGEEFVDLTLGFVGSVTDNPVETPAAGQLNAAPLNATQEFTTATDMIRLAVENVDDEGLLTDFDSLSVTISNSASARKTLGSLAATQINIGKFVVTIDFTAVFTNSDVIEAIRCDGELDLRFPLWNDDGGLYIHIPKMGLEGGDRSFPENESVTIGGTGYAYDENADGACFEISTFPLLPTRPCA